MQANMQFMQPSPNPLSGVVQHTDPHARVESVVMTPEEERYVEALYKAYVKICGVQSTSDAPITSTPAGVAAIFAHVYSRVRLQRHLDV